jgi:hypothetical protein
MSNRPLAAISTLVRWREFEEERASIELQRTSVEVEHAIACVDAADVTIAKVQQRLGALLEAPDMDLMRLQLATQIEDAAWRTLQASLDERALAQQEKDKARAGHLQTRARTHVAEARKQQMAAVRRDHEEKMSFDRMADLYRKDMRRAT